MIDRALDKPGKRRIVIFGGVYAAIHVEKLLAGERAVEICLVSHDNFFLFTPMLHEIAASDRDVQSFGRADLKEEFRPCSERRRATATSH